MGSNRDLISLDTTCLADVQPVPIQWLWKPYIPAGKITILEGDPEVGKTFLSLEIAASITCGKPLSDYDCLRLGHRRQRARNVLLLTAEDDLGDTIRPRFDSLGGDPRKFHALKGLIKRENGMDVPLSITLENIGALESALSRFKPALVIVDPFQAFFGARRDFHRANEVRPVMKGISDLAQRYRCAFLLIRHLAKAGSGNAMYRGIGSIDILAASRSVLLAGKNPQSPSMNEVLGVDKHGRLNPQPKESRFVFVQSKCNVAQKGPAIAYSIDCNGKFNFGGVVDVMVGDLLNSESETSAVKRKTATQFLRELLADGPVLAERVYAAAESQGISKNSLDRASTTLGVVKRPQSVRGQWYWSLPTAPNEAEAAELASQD